MESGFWASVDQVSVTEFLFSICNVLSALCLKTNQMVLSACAALEHEFTGVGSENSGAMI